jgi:hypothetical protein
MKQKTGANHLHKLFPGVRMQKTTPKIPATPDNTRSSDLHTTANQFAHRHNLCQSLAQFALFDDYAEFG